LYSSGGFALVRLPAAYTTGSSIMPQKRNPDVAELLRARAATVRAARREIEDIVSLPGGYHRDVQLTKAPLARGVGQAREALRVAARLAAVVEPTPAPQETALYAAAEAYRRRDQPFREAYRAVAAELAAGTFVATPTPPPPWDAEALRSRLGGAGRASERALAWERLIRG
jgi:argininosuccinate lyase